MQTSVLVIDDEPEIRRFLSKVFQKDQYIVFEAESAEAGIRAARDAMRFADGGGSRA